MYVQDVSLPPGIERKKKKTDRTQDYSSRSSMKSSHNDDRLGWNDVDTRQTELMGGEFMLQYFYSFKKN